jgi:hypothetical protein
MIQAIESEFEMKRRVCNHIESALDNYYQDIEMILNKIVAEEQPNTAHVDLLCRNDQPEDPGLSSLASYARFDYVEKCSQAEQAECRVELARATMDGKVLLRNLILKEDLEFETIEYKSVNAKDVDKEVKHGFAVELDCARFEPAPYMSKPLPFYPEVLAKVCGDAGYDYIAG